MNIAIIPARGGSKRIARKNIRLFHGKPIIAYSIEAAISANCFDKILVSTDDKEIAQIAKQYGALVPFYRPASLASDDASTLDVMQHALAWCEMNGIDCDFACCLYATAPFITAKILNLGLQKLKQAQCHFVFTALENAPSIARSFSLSSKGEISLFFPANEQTRSQELMSSYHDAGQFYWGTKEAFSKKLPIFSSLSKVIILPYQTAVDIDTQADWQLAEFLYSKRK